MLAKRNRNYMFYLLLASVFAFALLRTYLSDIALAFLAGLVTGIAVSFSLIYISTSLVRRNPVLTTAMKERVKTQELKRREDIKAERRAAFGGEDPTNNWFSGNQNLL